MREMIDSGVEWIGEIPVHWSLSKVGMFYNVVLGKMLQPEQSKTSDTYENYLCAANLGNNTLKYDVLKKMWFSEKDRQQYDVQKGDLIVVEGGDVASCDIVRHDVARLYIQNALHRVRPKKDFLPEFLRYTLMMAKDQGYISLICNKATIAHFTKDKFISLPLLVVPVTEQLKIVTTLDRKCEQVNTLISNVQAQIEKLKAYKQSLITEVVTKGLDPTVPMKDSGITWIGEIPEEWAVKPLLREIETIVDYRGKTPEKVDEGILLVTARNIKDGRIDYSISREYVRAEEYDEIMHRGKVNIGDVLFTTEAPLGAVANADRTDFALAQRIIKFTTKNTLNPYFLKYWILSSIFQQHLKSYATGSTATGIKASKLCLLQLVHPPISVQNAIVSALDKKSDQINCLITIKQAKIEKLEQYKRSLIYEYVTGKREVL